MQDFSSQPSLTETWNRYNQIRLSGDKKTANKLLITYIQLLKQQPASEIRRIVDDLCQQILDKSDGEISNNGYYVSEALVRIQHPLFKEIILPVLTEQYLCESARHIKWIGQLEQFFYSDASTSMSFLKALNLPFPFMALHFFEKSYAIDPQQHTLKLILAKMAQTINYFFHELPYSVLAHPDLLIDRIAAFSAYCQQADDKDTWQDTLSYWEFFANCWADYSANSQPYEHFKAYLCIRAERESDARFLDY